MKKIILTCLVILTTITCSILPAPKDVLAANSTTEQTSHLTSGIFSAVRLPAKNSSSIQLSYVELEEKEKWILDEVLSDYVSEAVVELTESGTDYTIGEWIDREAYTCLILGKKLPAGSLYTACGYTKVGGSYVYFELSSEAPLTEQLVRQEIERNFSEKQQTAWGIC